MGPWRQAVADGARQVVGRPVVAVRPVALDIDGTPIIYGKALEVRNKPVRPNDIGIFARLCVNRGVREAAMVLVSPKQKWIDDSESARVTAVFGIRETIFLGWQELVSQCLFWAPLAAPSAATLAAETIKERLVEVEVMADAI